MIARRLSLWLIAFSVVGICSGTETVCLKTGFCLNADSHTEENGRVLCRVGQGTLEIPATQIFKIETDPSTLRQPVSSRSSGDGGLTPEELIRRVAFEQGLPADFVASVARVESDNRQRAVSPRGAIGLMQLMPATAADLGVKPQLATENVEGGAKYLRALLLKYRGDSRLALSAYNAGPGAVARFGGMPPYEETRRYVVKVLREYEREQKLRPRTETVGKR
jgi:hypothetical protein